MSKDRFGFLGYVARLTYKLAYLWLFRRAFLYMLGIALIAVIVAVLAALVYIFTKGISAALAG